MNFNNDDDIVIKSHPVPMEITSGPLAGKTIRFAPTLEIDDYKQEFEKFQDALYEVSGIAGMLATDQSSIYDLHFDSADCDALARKLGVEVGEEDLIVEVLRRMRK